MTPTRKETPVQEVRRLLDEHARSFLTEGELFVELQGVIARRAATRRVEMEQEGGQ